ncbi:hypothetical protein RS3R1_49820 [Pseudomonas atacamensis]|uniref:Uncharacterized protein n=1 Tax=Pseudomonas atacamensis TaxID=2565368 RepID=A0ABQ5PQR9_9PSED|nr:hypothetical protein RS3R1_49820 [Pseudomonas atacamensis]
MPIRFGQSTTAEVPKHFSNGSRPRGTTAAYSQLTAFIRGWRGEQGKALGAFVPPTFALGEAFQFD